MTTCRWDAEAGDYLTGDGDPCRTCARVPERLDALSDRGTQSECWPWKSTLNSCGYGVLSIHDRQYRAHRVVYELQRGPIPDGLVIDHLCRNRACVNPDHLEPVPPSTNTLRGISPWAVNARRTVCKNGHPFTPENTRMDKGKRYCLACKRISNRDVARKRRAKAKESA